MFVYCCTVGQILAAYQLTMKLDAFSWEKIWGENGSVAVQAHRTYNFDIHHRWVTKLVLGMDFPIGGGISSHVLAQHFGNLTEAKSWMKTTIQLYERLDESSFEYGTKILFSSYWPQLAQPLGWGSLLLPVLEKEGFTWEHAERMCKKLSNAIPMFRPAGDKTMGLHPFTTELFSWLIRLNYALLTDVDVTPDEMVQQLPTVEDFIWIFNAGLAVSLSSAMFLNNPFALAAEVLEKYGQHEQALIYAEVAATNTDVAQGGCNLPQIHTRGYAVKGRILAVQGKLEEAEAALESAASIAAEVGLFLQGVLAVRDLKLHVLDQTERGTEGTARLKAAIVRLLGETPDSKQLAELAHALGPKIDTALVMS
eukprot:COSAG01_NODE_5878_length_3973_cov_1.477284_2_plen_367_part_00